MKRGDSATDMGGDCGGTRSDWILVANLALGPGNTVSTAVGAQRGQAGSMRGASFSRASAIRSLTGLQRES